MTNAWYNTLADMFSFLYGVMRNSGKYFHAVV